MNDQQLQRILDYLLSIQLNVNINSAAGEVSNQRLRALFMELLEQVRPRVFFDIGARDGESATEVRKRLPDCRAYAFEANPRIFAQFAEANVRAGLIDYRHLALSNACGSVDLHVPTVSSEVMIGEAIVPMHYVEAADTGRSSILPRTDLGAQYEKFTVATTTLDQFCVAEQIAYLSPTAVWIDVEGAASLVIEGAKEALKNAALVFVEVEGHAFWQGQSHCGAVIGALTAMGFVPIARDREYHDKQFNVLLLRPEHLHLVNARLYDLKGAVQRLKSWPSAQEPGADALDTTLPRARARPPARNLVPIIVPAFNNPTFLRGMLAQLAGLGCENVTVLDNASTYPPMLAYLDELAATRQVLRLPDNLGPRRVFQDLAFYQSLPRIFCVTDPDLQFNEDMPADFIERLLSLSEEFKEGKVGLALRIDEALGLRQDEFDISGRRCKIADWEAQFWRDEAAPGVYRALIDTTFALYNKSYFDPSDPLRALRVAGPYACVHLPWLQNFRLPQEEADFYSRSNRYSFYMPNVEAGPPAS